MDEGKKKKKLKKKGKEVMNGRRGRERVVDDLPMWRCYALPSTPLSQPRPLYKQRSWSPDAEQDEV